VSSISYCFGVKTCDGFKAFSGLSSLSGNIYLRFINYMKSEVFGAVFCIFASGHLLCFVWIFKCTSA